MEGEEYEAIEATIDDLLNEYRAELTHCNSIYDTHRVQGSIEALEELLRRLND